MTVVGLPIRSTLGAAVGPSNTIRTSGVGAWSLGSYKVRGFVSSSLRPQRACEVGFLQRSCGHFVCQTALRIAMVPNFENGTKPETPNPQP